MMKSLLSYTFILVLILLSTTASRGAELTSDERTRVLDSGERLEDRRMTELKDYRTPWTFEKPSSLAEWATKREYIRRKVLLTCGLWPMPERGPVEVEVFDRVEHEDYTIEKVLLKTLPGYYATGNLFRPKQNAEGPKQRFPGVLCPHGHWENGRNEDSERASVPGRAINLARQGYVVFTYDMVGYEDNAQLLSHGFGGDREALYGLIPAGIQLFTSIRGLDFLETLEDVDSNKLGCTGASGGGTQTFLLYAVENRVKVAAPVNMISAHMQGGCKCENAPGLRLDLNNMDIGATMAPRVLCMVSASGDWTKNTPTVEYPAIASVYELYNRPKMVMEQQVDAPHNYDKNSREIVYKWFGKWFYRERPETDFVEEDFVVDASAQLRVFASREVPADALKEAEFFASMREASEARLWEYMEKHPTSFASIYGLAYQLALAVKEPESGEIETSQKSQTSLGGHSVEKFLLQNASTGQSVPANLWLPQGKVATNPVVLVHPAGKGGILNADGSPGESLSSYLSQGSPVLAIDALGTGEFIADASWEARTHARASDGVAHFDTYNLTDTAGRVQDILLAESYLADRFGKPAKMVGLPGAGGWVLLAHGLATRSAGTEADLSGLVFTEDKAFVEQLYIPNVRKVGDFVTSLVLGGDRPAKWTGLTDEAMTKRLARAQEFGASHESK